MQVWLAPMCSSATRSLRQWAIVWPTSPWFWIGFQCWMNRTFHCHWPYRSSVCQWALWSSAGLQSVRCPAGWLLYYHVCYFIISISVTHYNWLSTCADCGLYHLALLTEHESENLIFGWHKNCQGVFDVCAHGWAGTQILRRMRQVLREIHGWTVAGAAQAAWVGSGSTGKSFLNIFYEWKSTFCFILWEVIKLCICCLGFMGMVRNSRTINCK